MAARARHPHIPPTVHPGPPDDLGPLFPRRSAAGTAQKPADTAQTAPEQAQFLTSLT